MIPAVIARHTEKIDRIRRVKRSNDTFNAHLFAQALDKRRTVFVVLPNLYDAQRYYDRLSQIVNAESVLFYPADQTLTAIMALGSPEFKSERLYTIKQLMTGAPFIVVTTMQGLSQRQLTPKDHERGARTLLVDRRYDMKDLVQFLVYSGYTRSYTVENPGEFSVRGSILDVFTLHNENPYRLDFFDDQLEEIKLFDVETQRSFAAVERVEIAPMHELFYTDSMKRDAIEKIRAFFFERVLSEREKEKLEQDLEALELRQQTDALAIYTPFFNEEETTVLDFSPDHELYLVDVERMRINEDTIKSDLETYATAMHGRAFLDIPFRLELDRFLALKRIEIDNYGLHSGPSAYDLDVHDVDRYQGNLSLLTMDIRPHADSFRIIFAIPTETFRKRLLDHLEQEGIPYRLELTEEPGVYVLDRSYQGSFRANKDLLWVIDETDLFLAKTRKAIRYRSVLNQAKKIRRVEDLAVGDYVVHYDYGIGRYVGLKTMELSQEKRDYLHIIYAGEEALYVPMDQIDLVLKYSSHDGVTPKLSKLGGKQWSKTKANVRKRIKDLSDRLIRLYATRQKSEGFAFQKDDAMQEAFERDFPYILTKDQEKAIINTKYDMEQPKPMDRLICGDVGFGKTEVALRAAFKAVLSAKQVLYLVPTTVLARQHYYTFKERFDKYGANVALLSRFVRNKDQTETLKKLARGYIDVVIGTHRLLSKDVKFKDLGLLIVDEEQRFGVEHKERIREIKANVDTLTLSATPIPRTLQMSIMGLKDLSMIETPPLNRYPVQTYVVEWNEALIKEAITRELARGGQVFYLFNRIRGIEGIVQRLKRLIPGARVAHAHGRMQRDELEQVISDFIEHNHDVLVSTTIIETGVDIPNTNTLIVHDADRLGLAQLYQIRGRVGRTDRIAYAYLFYSSAGLVNEEARKRLNAIQDFTALGSGFKIAMRDLAIRGAGDLLGQEQSGFIDSVGIELYMKLLEEAVSGETLERPQKQDIEHIYAPRHVDPNYVENDSVRIEVHKRISALNRLADIEELKSELTDRFGDLDAELLLYMYEKLFKKLSAKLGVQKTIKDQDQVKLVLSLEASERVDGQRLFKKANAFDAPIRLGYLKGHVEITLVTKDQDQHWLYLMDRFLDDYLYG
ncbi:MAG: transcription-repair coupling factor [Acholeplasmataceae bacterium]